MVLLSDSAVVAIRAPLAVRLRGRTPVSLEQGVLNLGAVPMECHVLDTGDRVLTQRSAVHALTGKEHTATWERSWGLPDSSALSTAT